MKYAILLFLMASGARAADLSGALTIDQRRQLAAAHSPEEAQSLKEKFGIAKMEEADLNQTIARYSQRPEEPETRDELRTTLRKAYYSTDSNEEKEKIREAFRSNPLPNERAPASIPAASRVTGQ